LVISLSLEYFNLLIITIHNIQYFYLLVSLVFHKEL
jgi:hypothetical protein